MSVSVISHIFPEWSDERMAAVAMDGVSIFMQHRYNIFSKADRAKIWEARNLLADVINSACGNVCGGPRTVVYHGAKKVIGTIRCDECGLLVCKKHIIHVTYSGAHVPPDEERELKLCPSCRGE